MCRHAAWLGPVRPVSWLVSEPEHGLLRQSYAPRMQRHGTVNADGFGVGWYDETLGRPVRYRRTVPLWTDANLPGLAAAARSACLMAAVRSATVGMPIEETATAPFTDGSRLLSHNGRVRRGAVRAIAGEPESLCDSAWLASAVFARLGAGASLGDALTAVVRHAAVEDPPARLNLLVVGAAELAAVAWGDTLFTHLDEGVLVASEPLDDRPGWRAVPDRTLLLASPDGVLVTPID
ncbi:ergothioneine biosynthesis protein EgtC [Microbispora sp. RL4-1S]|uniref:Gamma-glutamyl-hercynylcysteine sulfoxide hydrolase n=1 Tax=Microbispora oryzae TaxID=2806554 RepID=A0A941AGL6_9ACTN|nr:ergothioneine biosynthesis protein EgtC [Microbispora oryzae]MBP2703075.1 ergothioneine biosynthesis protein EgtC [Microbispora oryzae]